MSSANRFQSHHEEETDGEGTWAVSYGDMVTLLLTFFIVFFSIDPKENTKSRVTALQVSLLDELNSRAQNVVGAAGSPAALGEKKEAGMNPEPFKEFNGKAYKVGDHIIIDFPGVSFFDSGKVDLNKDGHKAIEKFMKIYMPYAGSHVLSIRAYTDMKKVIQTKNRRFKDNLELSALRSVASMRALQKSGLPLSRMRVGGYGELVITEKELHQHPEFARGPASEYDLARKVVLVIEPEGL